MEVRYRVMMFFALQTFLRPFVEVTFQGFRRATGAASSYSPTWNEEIAIPFSPPNNDFSPSNLQTIDENIFINVFDQIKIDLVQVSWGGGGGSIVFFRLYFVHAWRKNELHAVFSVGDFCKIKCPTLTMTRFFIK